ncbi:helix-hairpin-helix domain-containing protein [Deinococcus sp. KSM4-11]|uniref:ComEA family DNA-binding protein n=1 Tax=Deinococcus sp. KSM4-11 TaxID=2568654 RepID=UPI0010A2B714|nr:helix-hairpin-helix domain-containing protein [Deinococcus sp. KSM4-11]THF84783.1 helix-hairpin-helix domain-containing protein [Deinococcus sp. KSM4-11]
MRTITLMALTTLTLLGAAFAASGTTTPATPASTPATTVAGPMLTAGQTVNVNTAPLADLEKVPGLGVKLATAILQARPYKNQADLVKKVKGIGKMNIKKFGPFLTY